VIQLEHQPLLERRCHQLRTAPGQLARDPTVQIVGKAAVVTGLRAGVGQVAQGRGKVEDIQVVRMSILVAPLAGAVGDPQLSSFVHLAFGNLDFDGDDHAQFIQLGHVACGLVSFPALGFVLLIDVLDGDALLRGHCCTPSLQ
jgi:hypothetical protein